MAAFELAIYPVTNAEFECFMQAGGYEDDSLWTAAGRVWLRGERTLDAEAEQQYRGAFRVIADDVEGVIAQLNLDDETADFYRDVAANWSEDDFLNAYAQQVLGEQRREPYYWNDSLFNGQNQPVVGVNWYEAMAYTA